MPARLIIRLLFGFAQPIYNGETAMLSVFICFVVNITSPGRQCSENIKKHFCNSGFLIERRKRFRCNKLIERIDGKVICKNEGKLLDTVTRASIKETTAEIFSII